MTFVWFGNFIMLSYIYIWKLFHWVGLASISMTWQILRGQKQGEGTRWVGAVLPLGPPACLPTHPCPLSPPRFPLWEEVQGASTPQCCTHDGNQPQANSHVKVKAVRYVVSMPKEAAWFSGTQVTLPTSFSGTPLKRAKNSTCSLPVSSSVIASNWGQ